MTFYNEMLAVADELLLEFGTPMVHQIVTEGVYNTKTLSITPSITTQSIIGVVTKFTSSEIALGNINAGDIKILVQPSSVTTSPVINDNVIVDNLSYKIKSIDILKPSTIILLYIIVAGL